jgi:hypothetical protein
MAYTATKYFIPKAHDFPRGYDNTQKTTTFRGKMFDCDTATEYCPGGIGSTSFEVTAFSAVGLVTYALLKGMQLVNGQKVVIYNTGSNTNDGTYIVSQLAPSSASAGTFVAIPLPNKALSGTGQTAQTAEGVGQLQFGQKQLVPQTFTVTAVSFVGGVMTVTYTTLTGPQLRPGQAITLAGMTNPGNNGNFTPVTVTPTSSTAGAFTVNNPNAVTTDSGTGTGNFPTGDDLSSASEAPVQVEADSISGWEYRYDYVNQTLRIFATGTASGDAANEAALGATVTFDSTLFFEAVFTRNQQ